MVNTYGSPSGWQRAMTYLWINKLVNNCKSYKFVLLEGQVNVSFIIEEFKKINFNAYKILLIHCGNAVRYKRLQIDREQPELVNESMDNGANFLKKTSY